MVDTPIPPPPDLDALPRPVEVFFDTRRGGVQLLRTASGGLRLVGVIGADEVEKQARLGRTAQEIAEASVGEPLRGWPGRVIEMAIPVAGVVVLLFSPSGAPGVRRRRRTGTP
jgi:hypothetical protein